MKLKTVAVTYGRKLNLGDYNSAHSEISLWADMEEGDSPEKVAEALRQFARAQVMSEMSRLDTNLAAKMESVFAGLPMDVQAEIEDFDNDEKEQ